MFFVCIILIIGVSVGIPTDFIVDTNLLGKDKEEVTCCIINPSGNHTDNVIETTDDGTCRISYVPYEEGILCTCFRSESIPVL